MRAQRQGGRISKLTSIVTIYNEILRRRPDLLELLCQDYWRARPTDEDGRMPARAFALPVFGVQDGKLTCQYSRTYVEQAQEFPEVPPLTADAERGAGPAGRGRGGRVPLLAVRPWRHPVPEQSRHFPRPHGL